MAKKEMSHLDRVKTDFDDTLKKLTQATNIEDIDLYKKKLDALKSSLDIVNKMDSIDEKENEDVGLKILLYVDGVETPYFNRKTGEIDEAIKNKHIDDTYEPDYLKEDKVIPQEIKKETNPKTSKKDDVFGSLL